MNEIPQETMTASLPVRAALPKAGPKATKPTPPIIPSAAPRMAAPAAPASAELKVHPSAKWSGIELEEPATVPPTVSPSATTPYQWQEPGRPSPAPAAPSQPGLARHVQQPEFSDEEKALIYAFRLARHAQDAKPLSQIERALIEGARAMFSQLAQACQDTLQGTDADSAAAHSVSAPISGADSAGEYVPSASPAPSARAVVTAASPKITPPKAQASSTNIPDRTQQTSSNSGSGRAGESLVERVARLEALLGGNASQGS